MTGNDPSDSPEWPIDSRAFRDDQERSASKTSAGKTSAGKVRAGEIPWPNQKTLRFTVRNFLGFFSNSEISKRMSPESPVTLS